MAVRMPHRSPGNRARVDRGRCLARRSCLMRCESARVARALHQVSMYQSRESMEWFTKETPYARGNHP
jgi:hypothetical protein